MIIERTNSEIIIRLPVDMNIDELQEMTDWFQYKEITRKLKAKQDDVDSLVDQIKKIAGKKEKQV
jgi:NADH pyrophosphatase NudC (nudix superfamily)